MLVRVNLLVMAAAFVGGAFLGAVFGELLKAVSEATKKAGMFKDLLKQLESTLKYTTPIIEQIEKLNRQLDLPKEETEVLKEMMIQGEQLVHKCSKVKWNNCFKRFDYGKKLLKLDSSINAYFRLNIPLQMTRDNREIMVMVKRLSGNEKNGWMFNQVGIVEACSVPDPPVITPGLDVTLKELKMDLLKNGKQVIVVSAPGGYGKTTLVKKLCKDDQVLDKFKDNIFFVIVSKTPNVKVIVQKVFQHKGYPVPEFQTDEVAINDLERLLKQVSPNDILLVLDDVWSGSESLLQKFKFQLPNYKILVTSRSVFPQFGTGHDLKPLNDEDARILFHYSANLQDGNSYIPDENLVNKILRACKGCPLALTVVGGSLCGQPEAIWQRRVKKWVQDVSIFDSNADILVCLKSSLDALNNEVKECYMDLCSFPEDQRIPITALIDIWMELYDPVEDGLFAITNLHELSNQNLVNRVVTRKNDSDNGCHNDHFVMQHDLLRELTIHQSMIENITQRKRLIIDLIGNNFPKWWVNQKEHPIKASLLSISTDETFLSNWYDMQVPEVKVVVLNIRTKKYTLPNFMEKMDEVKVLIVTNYGFFPTELSNFQVLGSVSNLKRIRLEHVSLPSMTTIQMKNLQKLSLVMCNVGQAFRNSTFQISDTFPNLLEIDIDYCNDLVELPDGLCDIVFMKKLRITNCHKLSALPEGIGKLVNLQMLTIASCTDLSALPDTVVNLSNLILLDISECLSIRELPEQIGELCSLKTLCMKGCSISELPSSIMNLENLEVVKCDEETACQLEYLRHSCTNLKIEVLQEDINLNWLHNPHL